MKTIPLNLVMMTYIILLKLIRSWACFLAFYKSSLNIYLHLYIKFLNVYTCSLKSTTKWTFTVILYK